MATTATESGKRTSAACRNTERYGRPENQLWVLPIEPFGAEGASFDLDEALAFPYYGPSETESDITRPEPSLEMSVSLMPTVCSTGVCAVCMEEFAVGSCGKMMPCSHVYHEECIAVWLAGGGSCPLCRCRVRPEC